MCGVVAIVYRMAASMTDSTARENSPSRDQLRWMKLGRG